MYFQILNRIYLGIVFRGTIAKNDLPGSARGTLCRPCAVRSCLRLLRTLIVQPSVDCVSDRSGGVRTSLQAFHKYIIEAALPKDLFKRFASPLKVTLRKDVKKELRSEMRQLTLSYQEREREMTRKIVATQMTLMSWTPVRQISHEPL